MSAYLRSIWALPRDLRLFFLYNLLANIGFGVFQLIFNLYLVELSLREDYIGAFNGVQTIFMALAGITLGTMLGKFGTWRCMVGGVGMLFVVSYLLAFIAHPGILIVLSALYGIGLCYLFNITMPFIMEFCPTHERARVAALSFSLISLAVTLGSLVGGFVPDLMHRVLRNDGAVGLESYRWTLVIGTTVALAGMAPLLTMRDARRSTLAQELARAVSNESHDERRQARSDVLIFVAVGGLMSLGAGMVIPFYNVFLTSLGADSREVGYVFAAGSGCAALVGLSAPWVSRRFGALNAVLLLRVAMMPFYALLIFMPSYGLAILAHAVRQTSISMAWPIDSTFIGEVLPPRSRAAVFGWRSGAWNLGSAVAAIGGGWVIVRSGYGVPFLALIVFTLLSTILFVGYFRRHPMVRSGKVAAPSGRKRAAEAERAVA